MPIANSDVSLEFWKEGSQMSVTFTRVDDNNGLIEWTLPKNIKHYDGVVVLMKTTEISVDDIPRDRKKYIASADWAVPADDSGDARVVGAFYRDKMTTSLNVINLVPDDIYFVGIFAVTNTLSYYSDGRYSYAQFQSTDKISGHIEKADEAPDDPIEGQIYFDENTQNIKMWDGTTWVDTVAGTVPAGIIYPNDAIKGEFFYHSGLKDLFVYTGTDWKKADDFYDNTPSYTTRGIGTDGSMEEFNRLLSEIKYKMGWPVTCLELQHPHFEIALYDAIDEFRRRSDSAYKRRLVVFDVKKGQSTYYLNDPTNFTDEIVFIHKIQRINKYGVSSYGHDGYVAQPLLNMLYQSGKYDLTTFHALSEYSELSNKLFAGDIGFTWDEQDRHLTLWKAINGEERVVLDTSCERTNQELLLDRFARPWIEDWAQAEIMHMLGLIRSKYGTLPGPNGGITMNGTELIQYAREDFEELKRQILDFEVGNGADLGAWDICIG